MCTDCESEHIKIKKMNLLYTLNAQGFLLT